MNCLGTGVKNNSNYWEIERESLKWYLSPLLQWEVSYGVIGFVVANEMDSMRANMLAYQTLKLNVHNIVVINNDGTKIPEKYSFDRVLCDVPCSGDGTIRKNDGIEFKWLLMNHISSDQKGLDS